MIFKNLLIGTVTLILLTSVLAEGKGAARVGVQTTALSPVLAVDVDRAVDSVHDTEKSTDEPKATGTTKMSQQDFLKNPEQTSSSRKDRTESLADAGWLSEVNMNILIIATAIIIVLGMLTCCKRCTCSWKVGEFELTNRGKFWSLHGCFPSACSRGLGGDGED